MAAWWGENTHLAELHAPAKQDGGQGHEASEEIKSYSVQVQVKIKNKTL